MAYITQSEIAKLAGVSRATVGRVVNNAGDDVPATRDMVRNGTITATICQQPERQGRMALSVLFDYLIEGNPPSSNRLYTDIQIKVAANIDT